MCGQRRVACGGKDRPDGGGRLARVKHGSGQQRHDGRPVRADDPRVEELSLTGLELGAGIVLDVGQPKFRAAPDVDQGRAFCAEEAPVRPFDRPEACAFVLTQLDLDVPAEASAGQRVTPECATALLEPGVLGHEGARSRLELGPHLRDAARPPGGSPHENDSRGGLQHSHGDSAGVPCPTRPRMENRIFFPQAALDQWIVDGLVDLQDGNLTIVAEGRRFKLVEATLILREVSGNADAHELLGRVKTRSYVEQLGAEIIESSMLIGDVAYEVEPGWVGVPIGSFSEYLASDARARARGADGETAPKSDEDLLAGWLRSQG